MISTKTQASVVIGVLPAGHVTDFTREVPSPGSAPILFCDWPSLNVALVLMSAAITGYDPRAETALRSCLVESAMEKTPACGPSSLSVLRGKAGKAALKPRLATLNT